MSTRWTMVVLYLLGLAVYGTASFAVQTPGYMDADYYYATGLQLAEGGGLTEPFLWNYIDDPDGLPRVSHLYWMPLPTLLASGSMTLLARNFQSAQLPFILLAAALPPSAAFFAHYLSRNSGMVWMAGIFALFPGFYLPFLVTVDSFAAFALAGGWSLWVLSGAVKRPTQGKWFLAGLLMGIAGLARADGILLLAVGLLGVMWSGKGRVSGGLLLGFGFLAIMGPWWARNVAAAGSPLNVGSQRLLWMLEYNDLFAFPASQLTFDRWWEAGFAAAAQARLQALSTNLQRLVAEGGMIFLAPFMLIGGVRKRSEPLVRLMAAYLAALLLIMTIAFPFIGPRGALFHSMSAVLLILWALAPIGIRAGIKWLGAKWGWNLSEAWHILGASAVLLAIVLTIGLFANRFAGNEDAWNAGAETYQKIATSIAVEGKDLIAINNPPGLYAHSRLPAVAIPNGQNEALRQVVDAYGVGWVVLEANHPEGLRSLHAEPESLAWLSLFDTLEDAAGEPVYILQVRR